MGIERRARTRHSNGLWGRSVGRSSPAGGRRAERIPDTTATATAMSADHGRILEMPSLKLPAGTDAGRSADQRGTMGTSGQLWELIDKIVKLIGQ